MADPKNIDPSAVKYYFDGVEWDRASRNGLTLRTHRWVALREKLLQLPPSKYEAAIEAIEAIVKQYSKDVPPPDEKKDKAAAKANEGKALFEKFEKKAAN